MNQLDDVAAALGWPGDTITVTPIAAGITNHNWRVDVPGAGSYVVRRFGANTGVLGIDRDNELAATALAARLRVGPTLVAALPELGALVTEFIDGVHPPLEDLRSPPQLAWVAEAMARFHTGGTVPGTFNCFRIAEQYAAEASSRGVTVPAAYERLHEFAERVEAAFSAAPAPIRACHNDLLPANVLVAGDHVVLLDYEYAGMGDPFFDLGNFSVNAGLDDDGDYALLEAYFAGSVAGTCWARLKLMRILSELREGMWSVVQQAVSTLDHVDFVAYANEHLDRGVELAGDPRFDDWLAAAEAPVA